MLGNHLNQDERHISQVSTTYSTAIFLASILVCSERDVGSRSMTACIRSSSVASFGLDWKKKTLYSKMHTLYVIGYTAATCVS